MEGEQGARFGGKVALRLQFAKGADLPRVPRVATGVQFFWRIWDLGAQHYRTGDLIGN